MVQITQSATDAASLNADIRQADTLSQASTQVASRPSG